MLTVWCVCVGAKYSDNDVYILREMVDRNLNRDHEFKCLTDRHISGVDSFIPGEVWPGWWSKIMLFWYAQGTTLYLDLDTVVVGNLDCLLSTQLSMAKNWAQSGHGGCQSSVMAWRGDHRWIVHQFEEHRIGQPENGNHGYYHLPNGKKLWGDQEFITEVCGSPGEGAIHPMSGVYSYKYHCRGKEVPQDASVIAFHGNPKPSECSEPWIIQSRSTRTAA